MERIKLLTTGEASPEANKILEKLSSNGNRIINIFKVMANSPAVIKTFFNIKDALKEKTISDEIEERISILLAVMNGCEYCLAAHSYSGSKILPEEELLLAQDGKSSDVKAQAALDFATSVMKNAGKLSDEEFQRAKNAGFSDGELLEIVAIVTINFFTNAINSVAETKVDFPKPIDKKLIKH